ncbi:hypothetical protein IP78_14520 [Brevundimonas sp. AAP58]|uniref:DUF305 domain-containing protein n=1 Tax=Brevundimonas sp. AAP58 TaxID=1523422 RepID=UPI0006B93B66|nr:DUF305 domain-containing protein [Brevundimonas sp. AAP58]KPF73931.1 hypothetical protein IP78_14520 [Brevundimonas sp. AAP58]
MLKFAPSVRHRLGASAAATVLLFASGALAQQAPIVQPGAPGQATRTLNGDEASRIADNRYSADDVKFMQDMILHHAQAVEMANLVQERTNTQAIRDIAGRINASQADEIEFMRGWLTERGETAPNPAEGHAMASMDHSGHAGMDHSAHAGHAQMAGMATPAQMAALAAASGEAFDQQFLNLMIAHHEGAVTMVADLLGRSGSAYDPVLFRFVNDITSEQTAEINRMSLLLRERAGDPRSTLAAGFRDAGQAEGNLRLVASLPKPTGFFDPANPEGLPPPVPSANDSDDTPASPSGQFGRRAPFLSFANTDMAFSGDLLAVGNYHGFNLYRLSDASPEPQLISSVVCPGGQGDVSIHGNLLLMSVESNNGRVDCGRQGVGDGPQADRFRGLRVFDISDRANPVQVGQVQTCRGSHTHSIVSADSRRLIVYNSGTAGVRDERELAGCVVGLPGDNDTALFSIDVIEIPLADPSQARIIDSPRVFADDATGAVAGLWRGGDHGEGTQTTSRTDQCHDITLFPDGNLAGGACSGNGILMDISNPAAPRRIAAVNDPGFAYWHSATFNNDGTKVVFTDEWGGGGRPRCRVQDPVTWGANAIYDIVDNQLVFRSYYKLPAPQTARENCVAHNGSLIPVPGRDLFVQAWYQGGLSISDFTDSANPREIAYFDRGPISEQHDILGGFWSVYWYNGRIYGTEIARGLDVLELTPSEHLTENEIAAARMAQQGETVNPQQQFRTTWPAHPVVARAYLDQLTRDGGLPADQITAVSRAVDAAAPLIDAGSSDTAVAQSLRDLAAQVGGSGADTASRRRAGLAETLIGIASRLS